MSEHVLSVIRDEGRPYVVELWCSCTRFGAVAEVRRARYLYVAGVGDEPEVWFDSYDEALAYVLRGHLGVSP